MEIEIKTASAEPRREQLGPGVWRVHHPDGSKTDICVSNEPGGPMDFMYHREPDTSQA